MAHASYELRYIEAGLDQLEGYLLSPEVFWPIGVSSPAGTPSYPQLTLGALLLSLKRAHTLPQAATERATLARLDEQLDSVRSRWRVAWGKKAANEFRVRLNLWRNYMEDYRDNPSANIDRYPYEVQRRAQLHLLEPEADEIPPTELSVLTGLDNLLKAVLVPGEFVWDDELADGFPEDTYWFLYGTPRDS